MQTINKLPGNRFRVLLIEDNPADTKYFRITLFKDTAQYQFELLEARTLTDGIAQLKHQHSDIVFLDLNLPDSMAIDTFRKLNAEFPAIPIVVLSSTGTESLAMQTVEEGAQDYVFKENLDNRQLVRTIRYAAGRMRIVNELKAAKQKAEELAKYKAEFLANMSHEIRTPLNGVIGLTDLLLESQLTSEQRESAELIKSSGSQLLVLINDILDFSKIDAGKLQLENITFKPRVIVEEVLELFSDTAREKNIVVTNIIDPKVPSLVIGDPIRLRQILTNLFGNGIKFTQVGEVVLRVGVIDVGAGLVRLRFEIHDTGMGIEPEKIGLLFESFTQVDSSITRRFGGSGLGLAISKKLVELMNGEISVQSTVGKGTQFWFEIPYAMAPETLYARYEFAGKHAAIFSENYFLTQNLIEQLQLRGITAFQHQVSTKQPPKSEHERNNPDVLIFELSPNIEKNHSVFRSLEEHRYLSKTPVLIIYDRGENVPTLKGVKWTKLKKPIRQAELYRSVAMLLDPTGAMDYGAVKSSDVPNNSLSKHTGDLNPNEEILVVEDNSVNQKVIGKMLENLGYLYQIVSSGAEALQVLRTKKFILILMDCQMPELDGFETSRQIRKTESKRHRTPIVAVTAYALQGDKEKCTLSGMDDYLAKPIQLEPLRAVIEKWIARKGENDSEESTERKTGSDDKYLLLLDENVLTALRALKGNGERDFLDELIQLYLEVAPTIVIDLEVAVQKQSAEQVSHLAHRLKGMSANLGANRLTHCCEELESLSRSGKLTGSSFLFKKISDTFLVTKKNLEQNWVLRKECPKRQSGGSQ